MEKTHKLARMAIVAIALVMQAALSAGQFSSTQADDLPSLERRVSDARAKLTSAEATSTTVSNPARADASSRPNSTPSRKRSPICG